MQVHVMELLRRGCYDRKDPGDASDRSAAGWLEVRLARRTLVAHKTLHTRCWVHIPAHAALYCSSERSPFKMGHQSHLPLLCAAQVPLHLTQLSWHCFLVCRSTRTPTTHGVPFLPCTQVTPETTRSLDSAAGNARQKGPKTS